MSPNTMPRAPSASPNSGPREAGRSFCGSPSGVAGAASESVGLAAGGEPSITETVCSVRAAFGRTRLRCPLPRRGVAAQPRVEVRVRDPGLTRRDEGRVVHPCAEVARVRVRDDLPGVALFGEHAGEEVGHRAPDGPRDLL